MKLGTLFLCDGPGCPAEISIERGTCSPECATNLQKHNASMSSLNEADRLRRFAAADKDQARRQGWAAASAPAVVGSQGMRRAR